MIEHVSEVGTVTCSIGVVPEESSERERGGVHVHVRQRCYTGVIQVLYTGVIQQESTQGDSIYVVPVLRLSVYILRQNSSLITHVNTVSYVHVLS